MEPEQSDSAAVLLTLSLLLFCTVRTLFDTHTFLSFSRSGPHLKANDLSLCLQSLCTNKLNGTHPHKLIWHFISPLMRHVSLLTHSVASLHKSWSLPFFFPQMHPSQHIGFADMWRSFLMSDLIWSWSQKNEVVFFGISRTTPWSHNCFFRDRPPHVRSPLRGFKTSLAETQQNFLGKGQTKAFYQWKSHNKIFRH